MKFASALNLSAKSLVFVAAAALTAHTAQAVNIASNGGFEVAGPGGPTDSAQWSEFAGGPAGTVSERSSAMPFSGNWSQFLNAVGTDAAAGSAGINQNSISDGGFVSLQENTTIDASFQWKGDLGPGGVAFAALRVLNGDGAIVADSGLQGLSSTGGNYVLQSLGPVNVPSFGGGANDTYAAFIEISVASGAFAGSTASGYVDDVVINGTLVPEPASLALLGLGGLAMVGRRRRKA